MTKPTHDERQGQSGNMPSGDSPAMVVNASPADIDRCIAILVAAFVADPFVRWMLPEPEQYFEYFPRLFRHFGGRAFDQGSACRTADFGAAALWLAPGIEPDEEGMNAVMEEAVADELRGDVLSILEQVDASHPTVDHWYLPAIGVDPLRQGQGYGAALLAHGLAVCDAVHVAAYLESSNPTNIPLYERFGFEVVGEFRVGDSPALTPMFRAAR